MVLWISLALLVLLVVIGRFGYAIPLPDGRWRVSLLFVDPREKADTPRRFDVLAHGERVLASFDPVAAAGGTLTGVERSFDTTVANGRLDLRFVPVEGDAVLSALSVQPLD